MHFYITDVVWAFQVNFFIYLWKSRPVLLFHALRIVLQLFFKLESHLHKQPWMCVHVCVCIVKYICFILILYMNQDNKYVMFLFYSYLVHNGPRSISLTTMWFEINITIRNLLSIELGQVHTWWKENY